MLLVFEATVEYLLGCVGVASLFPINFYIYHQCFGNVLYLQQILNRYIKLPDSWGGSSLFLFAEGSSELPFSLRPVITYLLYYFTIQHDYNICFISFMNYLILMS